MSISPICASPQFQFPTEKTSFDYFTITPTNKYLTLNVTDATISEMVEDTAPAPLLQPAVEFSRERPLGLPHLKKQITLPLISVYSELRLHLVPSTNFRQQILGLGSKVVFVDTIGNDYDQLTILDVRPFTEYVTRRVKGAINLCLPLTLLKRPNFTFQRCINSLPTNERNRFDLWLTEKANCGEPYAIYVYDASPTSSTIFHICQKMVSLPLLTDKCQVKVFGISLLPNLELIELGDVDNLPAEVPDQLHLPPLKIEETGPQTLPQFKPLMTPTLSNFALPKLPPASFKIRHNEELLTSRGPTHTSLTLEKNTANLFKLTRLPGNINTLPQWLQLPASNADALSKDFNKLEKGEQKRLIMALSLNPDANSQLSPLVDEVPPQILLGFEFGHKNRYKDIFLYEHLRVKLGTSNCDADYINASYINPFKDLGKYTQPCNDFNKQLSYIATQGPLCQTMGDFWKLVLIKQLPIVISLTDEVENGVLKCLPFWKTGVYYSNDDVINVKLVELYLMSLLLEIRLFSVLMKTSNGNVVTQAVLQLHVLSWPDMGTVLCPDELLLVVKLKNDVLLRLNLDGVEYPSVIHCLAGCGRTGTLCTIDTVISILQHNHLSDLPQDPILSIVDNLRQQRILMVQNLRQYYLVYDTVLDYLANPTLGDGLVDLSVIKNFIKGRQDNL